MENNYQGMTKSSFWANLFKTPTEKSELEEVLLSMLPFKNLSNKNFKLLMKVIHNRIYAANEYIFFQGDPGIGLYLIIRGEILITEEIDGERFDLAMLTRGDFFGELALLDEEKRSASAIALKDSQLAVIFKPDLDEFVETHSKVGIQILRGISQIVATRLRNLNQDYFTLYNKTRSK
ncbi:MAG: cyclic nucleotide-binding domain-containing protein [Ignavibacteriales bacterium]|jgi:CRP-like cAMP-binding protein|nr:cyclic nucleotide-binding domain-containing protein [Ignavibacteriales bacterium]